MTTNVREVVKNTNGNWEFAIGEKKFTIEKRAGISESSAIKIKKIIGKTLDFSSQGINAPLCILDAEGKNAEDKKRYLARDSLSSKDYLFLTEMIQGKPLDLLKEETLTKECLLYLIETKNVKEIERFLEDLPGLLHAWIEDFLAREEVDPRTAKLLYLSCYQENPPCLHLAACIRDVLTKNNAKMMLPSVDGSGNILVHLFALFPEDTWLFEEVLTDKSHLNSKETISHLFGLIGFQGDTALFQYFYERIPLELKEEALINCLKHSRNQAFNSYCLNVKEPKSLSFLCRLLPMEHLPLEEVKSIFIRLLDQDSSLAQERTLLEAALRRNNPGSEPFVGELIKKGANIGQEGETNPPLFLAIENRALTTCALFLEKGVDPLWKNSKGMNAIDYAISYHCYFELDQLLTHLKTTEVKVSPVAFSSLSESNRGSLAQVLLKHGLLTWKEEERAAVISSLLKAGAISSIPSLLNEKESPDFIKDLQQAICLSEDNRRCLRHANFIQFLSSIIEKYPDKLDKEKLFQYAVKEEMIEPIQQLVEKKVRLSEIPADTIYGQYPSQFSVDVLSLLLKHDIISPFTPIEGGGRGYSALGVLTNDPRSHTEPVLLEKIALLKEKEQKMVGELSFSEAVRKKDIGSITCQPRLRDASGKTWLHHAAKEGNLDLCKLLLPLFKEMPLDHEGYDPFHEAALSGHADIIEFFTSQGFDPHESKAYRDSLDPFFFAIAKGHFDLAETLGPNHYQPKKQFASYPFRLDPRNLDVFSKILTVDGLEWTKKNGYAKDLDLQELLQQAIFNKNHALALHLIDTKQCPIGAKNHDFFGMGATQSFGAPLIQAIAAKDMEFVQELIKRGALNPENRCQPTVSCTESREAAGQDDPAIFNLILSHLPSHERQHALSKGLLQNFKTKDKKIARAFLTEKLKEASKEEIEEILSFFSTLFGEERNIESMVLSYLLSQETSLQEWQETIRIIKAIITSIETRSEIFSLMKDENGNTLSTNGQVDSVLNEIFVHIFGKYHLEKSSKLLPSFFALWKQVDTIDQVGLLFNALQTCDSFDAVDTALKGSARRKKVDGSFFQDKEGFLALNPQIQEEWLAYFAVGRVRLGIPLILALLKKKRIDATLTPLALHALAQIGTPLKKGQLKILESFLDSSSLPVVEKAALALWACHPNPFEPKTRNQIFSAFNKVPQENSTMRCHLLEVLSYYHYERPKDQTLLDTLILAAQDSDIAVKRQAALTLSRLSDIPALLKAAEIVQGQNWDFMNEHFRAHEQHYRGKWDLFVKRPAFHNNRAAVLQRIQDQLIQIDKDKIKQKVDARYALYQRWKKADHELTRNELGTFSQISAIDTRFETLMNSTRFVGVPIVFPTKEGQYLFRGMKARKGEALMYEAVRDLIRKGCSSSDLSLFGGTFDNATWCKVGSMFGSSSEETAKCYSGQEGILILFDPAYFNEETRKGFTRVEKEGGSLNTVNFRGIPKQAILKVYVPPQYYADLELLASEKPLKKVQKKLQSPAFQNLSKRQLKELRIALLDRLPLLDQRQPMIKAGQEVTRSFFERFKPNQNERGEITNQFKEEGILSISLEEIREATLKNAIARSVVREKYGEGLLSQDEILTELDDGSYSPHAANQLSMLEDHEKMKNERASHGTTAEKKRVSIHEHTVEVVRGKFGGFGLTTALTLSPYFSLQQTRKILRLAALFHYTGRLSSRKSDYPLLSKQKAIEELNRRKLFFGVSDFDILLIGSLIEHHFLFEAFFRGKIDRNELSRRLTAGYNEIDSPKNPLSESDYRKMLFALYRAHASTLRGARMRLEPFKDFDGLDFKSLEFLKTINPVKAPLAPATSLKKEDFLSDLTDEECVSKLEEKLAALPYDFSAFKKHRAGHGHDAEGNSLSLFAHTLEVIRGQYGGFGLKTALTLNSSFPFSVPKILRLAALFHDAGKVEGRRGHIERSAEMAKEILSEKEWNFSQDEVKLISALILHNDLFYSDYLHHRQNKSLDDFKKILQNAYNKLSLSSVGEEDFRKLLFALWIADASTLTAVNKTHRGDYLPLWEKLDRLDFVSLTWLQDLKTKLRDKK